MNSLSAKEKWAVFLVIFAVTIGYQLVLAVSLSPLATYEGCDSLVFKQMGLAMLQGKVPYIDLFDHKGPVLYLINAMCQGMIPGRWGLFLFYCLYMAATTYVWWLMASLIVKSRGVWWSVALGLMSYMIVNSEGNLSEEWSLLPISYGLYVFVRHFVEGSKISAMAFFLVGLGMGVVTFIRINNMAAVCCAILVYTVYHLRQKTSVTPGCLLKSYLMILLGWATVIAVCCLIFWGLYGQEGLSGLVYGTFTFNFEYMGAPIAVASDRKRAYLFFGLTTLLLMSWLFLKKRREMLTVLIGAGYLGSFLAIGSKGWGNYFIILAPLTVAATACLYGVTGRWQKALLTLLFFAFVPFKFYLAYSSQDQDLPLYLGADKIIQDMPQEEQQRIWNDANFDGLAVLHRHGLTQVNRVVLYFQFFISESLVASDQERFDRVKPAWIMTSVPLQEAMPIPLDSLRTIHDYTLKAEVGEKTGRRLFFYQAN